MSVLVKASQASLQTPEALEQAHRAGFEVVAGTPEQLSARLTAEIPAVKELVARIGIKPESNARSGAQHERRKTVFPRPPAAGA